MFLNNDHLFFMNQAFQEATKSECPRTKVGCILVKSDQILLASHNSEITGSNTCKKNGCIRVINKTPSGSNIELCNGIHAEQKLIIKCAQQNINPYGATIYLTHSPCLTCAKILSEAGIQQIYYCIEYPNSDYMKLFNETGIKYIKLGDNNK